MPGAPAPGWLRPVSGWEVVALLLSTCGLWSVWAALLPAVPMSLSCVLGVNLCSGSVMAELLLLSAARLACRSCSLVLHSGAAFHLPFLLLLFWKDGLEITVLKFNGGHFIEGGQELILGIQGFFLVERQEDKRGYIRYPQNVAEGVRRVRNSAAAVGPVGHPKGPKEPAPLSPCQS